MTNDYIERLVSQNTATMKLRIRKGITMATKITTFRNGYTAIEGCPNCDEAAFIYYRKGQWYIEADLPRDISIKFCPECGQKLEAPEVPEADKAAASAP